MEDFLIRVLRSFGVAEYRVHEILFQLREFRRDFLPLSFKFALSGLLALGLVFGWYMALAVQPDQWLIQKLFTMRGPVQAPENLVMVGISDQTFGRLGISPRTHSELPRATFVDGLERVIAQKPRLVILDAAAVHEPDDPLADDRLIAAMEQVPITLGKGWPLDEPGAERGEYAILSDQRFLDAAAAVTEMFLRLESGKVWTLGTEEPTLTENPYSHFPLLQALQRFEVVSKETPPLNALINFYGPAGTINRVPFHELLEESASEQFDFADKVVVIGYQSTARNRHEAKEEFHVPLRSRTLYGAEIHATIASNMMDGSYLRRLSLVDTMMVQFLFLFFVTLSFFLFSFSRALLVSLLLLGGWTVATWVLFVKHSFFLAGLVLLLLGTVLAVLVAAVYRQRETRRQIERYREQFGLGAA